MKALCRNVLPSLLLALFAAPSPAQQTSTMALGSFQWETAPNGILIGAPHGTFDRNTGSIAVAAAKRLSAGYLVARGFNPGARINVSRPTEGASLACAQERETPRAREVYAEYERLVGAAANGAPLRLYVEVHGNSRMETSGRVEVAAKGISRNDAAAIKSEYPGILSAVKTEWTNYPMIALLIEPADRIYWAASCGKRIGTIAGSKISRVLHFEFPTAAREERMIPATGLLVARVVETLLAPAVPDRALNSDPH